MPPSTSQGIRTLVLASVLTCATSLLGQTPRARWTEPQAPAPPLARRPDTPPPTVDAADRRTVVSDALLQALRDYNDPRIAIAAIVVHADKGLEGQLQRQGVATTLGEGIKGYLAHPRVHVVAASAGAIDAIPNFSTLARSQPAGAAVELARSLSVDIVMLVTLIPREGDYLASYSIVDAARSQTLGAWSFDLQAKGATLDAARLRNYSAHLAQAFAEDVIRSKDAAKFMTIVLQGLNEHDVAAVRESLTRVPGVTVVTTHLEGLDTSPRESVRVACAEGVQSTKPRVLDAIRFAAPTPVRVVADAAALLVLEAAPFQSSAPIGPFARTPDDVPVLADVLRKAGNPRLAVLFDTPSDHERKPSDLTIEEQELRASVREKFRQLGATVVEIDVANARLRQEAAEASSNSQLELARQVAKTEPYEIAIVASGTPTPVPRYALTALSVASGRILAECPAAYAMDAVGPVLTPVAVERLASNAVSRLSLGMRTSLSTPTPVVLRVSNLWLVDDLERTRRAFAQLPGVSSSRVREFKVGKGDGFATLSIDYFGGFADLLVAMHRCHADLPFDFELHAATPEQLNLRLKDR